MPAKESKTWIQSRSGLMVPLEYPEAATIKIEDIAYALAGINRFTGHAKPRYNVAEHSVRVSILAARLTTRRTEQPCEVLFAARWGLLHDAAEAYIGDVSRPLKNCKSMKGYKNLERKWHYAIAVTFCLPFSIPEEVHEADYRLLGIEADQLMQPLHPEWAKTCPGGALPSPDRTDKLGWGSDYAEIEFLRRFRALWTADK